MIKEKYEWCSYPDKKPKKWGIYLIIVDNCPKIAWWVNVWRYESGILVKGNITHWYSMPLTSAMWE